MNSTPTFLARTASWSLTGKSRQLPLATLGLALVACLILPSSPLAQLLQYERGALAAGQWWRLLSCHWTHFSLEQLFWDVLAFVVFAWVCERQSRTAFCLCLASAGLLVPVAVWVAQPEIIVYRGISGLDVALFLCGASFSCLESVARKNWQAAGLAGLAIAVFFGKTCFEFATQSTLFVQPDAGFIPIPLAHLTGGLSGILAACLAFWTTRGTSREELSPPCAPRPAPGRVPRRQSRSSEVGEGGRW